MEKLSTISPELTASLFQRQEKISDLKQVAERFEALFIQQILKQARSAKLAEDLLGGEAVDTYTSMLDQERAEKLASNVNLGIAEALVAQFENVSKNPSVD
ncbi:MAG: rod-binding protein [Candidatus Puniceispirillaceae bacterium]